LAPQDRTGPGAAEALVAALDPLPVGLAFIGPDQQLLFQNSRGRELLRIPEFLANSDTLDAILIANDAKTVDDDGIAARPATILIEKPDGARVSVAIHALGTGASLVVMDSADNTGAAGVATGIDLLTGLPDRERFRSRLVVAMNAAATARLPLSVFHIDIRRFAAINEALGAEIGDAVLRRVSERLGAMIDPGAMAARFAGAEFGVLLPGADREAAAKEAEWLNEALGQTYPIDGHVINLGVAIGVATAPVDARGADEIMDRAQIALLRAKSDDAPWRQFEPNLERRLQERRSLEFDLRKALTKRELALHYQPQLGIGSGALVGFEALLRWRHPERGMVPPAAFIPLAEELGLIRGIGEWVLREACATAAAWPDEIGISVNVSPLQFAGRSLATTVMGALSATGLAPRRLTLEITESALINDEKLVLETMHQIRSLGVKTALDDFGTGYSSMATLSRFPFDSLKIDQSFVRGAMESSGCDAIVAAIATLGQNLGIPTTAEGVETEEQLRRMQAHGCTVVQGYLTGRPMPAEDASQLVGSGSEDASEAGAT
jgi:diguanylate cyclase (GGDEF)-like protein